MTCKDCIHDKICVITAFPEAFENTKWEKEPCDHFKNKAEYAEVKHGKWIECFEDWRKQISGDECSACGFQHYGCGISHYPYCPNCGAKMDVTDTNVGCK